MLEIKFKAEYFKVHFKSSILEIKFKADYFKVQFHSSMLDIHI